MCWIYKYIGHKALALSRFFRGWREGLGGTVISRAPVIIRYKLGKRPRSKLKSELSFLTFIKFSSMM